MQKNYVSPDYMKDSFTCPHCGALSLMHYVCVNYANGNYYSTTANNKRVGDSWILIATCHNCKKKIIWIDNIYAYPDVVAEEANADMPDSVKQLYDEANLIYNKSPRAACALLRLAIDRLCNELGETDRDINKNIGALVRKGLPQTVQQAYQRHPQRVYLQPVTP